MVASLPSFQEVELATTEVQDLSGRIIIQQLENLNIARRPSTGRVPGWLDGWWMVEGGWCGQWLFGHGSARSRATVTSMALMRVWH